MKIIKTLTLSCSFLATALALQGCNESDSSNAQNHARALNQVRLSSTLSRTDIDTLSAQAGLAQLAGSAKCGVKIYSLDFTTQGVPGETVSESGALMVPTGNDCETALPLMANAHGTRTLKNYTNTLVGNSLVDIALYVAQGYVVVAPDYLGLGSSDYGFHPYLHRDTEARSMVNSILAAQEAATDLAIDFSGKVMLKGYSQGGHSTIAAQRLIEEEYADRINLVASAPMAGPYFLEETLLEGIDADIVNISSGVLLGYIVQSYENSYGDIYEDVTDVFKSDYTETVMKYFPGDMGVFDLILGGFFPTDPERFLQADYLADFQANENNTLRMALKNNEVLDNFVPKTPMALCGSQLDGTVPFFNTTRAAEYFYDKGIEVPVIDVAPYVVVADDEDSGLAHHLQGNPVCNSFVRDQFFAQFL